jgi:hypothetical protein
LQQALRPSGYKSEEKTVFPSSALARLCQAKSVRHSAWRLWAAQPP